MIQKLSKKSLPGNVKIESFSCRLDSLGIQSCISFGLMACQRYSVISSHPFGRWQGVPKNECKIPMTPVADDRFFC